MKSDFKGKEKADIIIEGGIIATMNKKSDILSKTYVIVINDNKIVYVGQKDAAAKKYHAKEYIDAKNNMILPGLVNSHTHSPMTLFRGVADDIVLQDWLYKYVFPLEAKYIDPAHVRLGAKLALIEMIRTGTTTFNDMYYYMGVIAEVAEEIGIRAMLHEGLIDFPVPNAKTPAQGIKYAEKLLKDYKGHDLINFGFGTHSPYTCSTELLQKASKLSEKYNVPHNIHLSETEWEVNMIKEKYGKTPTQYLEKIGVLSERMIAAHCVKLSAKDIELLAKRKTGVAHNPQCNMKLASGAAPIPELLEIGVKTGLGTDGVVSNNNLDMFDEMNTCSLLHKFHKNDPQTLEAKKVVEMATIGSARVLGMEK
jgi:5-methylthioadenosine/S-adenosylhomocysteine deaminase